MEYVTIENIQINSPQEFQFLLNKYNIIHNAKYSNTVFSLKCAFNISNNIDSEHLIRNEFHINYYRNEKAVLDHINSIIQYINQMFNIKNVLTNIILNKSNNLNYENMTYIKLMKSIGVFNKLDQSKDIIITDKLEEEVNNLLYLTSKVYPRGSSFGDIRFSCFSTNFSQFLRNETGYYIKPPFATNLTLFKLPLILKQYILNNTKNINNKIKTLDTKYKLQMISQL